MALPTYAVSSFSCAALHGICCTRTCTPAVRRSNSGRSCCTTSPSRPMAQNSMTAGVSGSAWHPRSSNNSSPGRQRTHQGIVGRAYHNLPLASRLADTGPAGMVATGRKNAEAGEAVMTERNVLVFDIETMADLTPDNRDAIAALAAQRELSPEDYGSLCPPLARVVCIGWYDVAAQKLAVLFDASLCAAQWPASVPIEGAPGD